MALVTSNDMESHHDRSLLASRARPSYRPNARRYCLLTYRPPPTTTPIYLQLQQRLGCPPPPPPLRLVHYLHGSRLRSNRGATWEPRPRPRPIHETTSHPGAGRTPKPQLLPTLRKGRRSCVRRVIVKGFFTTTTRIVQVYELTSCWC